MAHSVDLRRRVVAYVESGGSKAEAARIFQVSRPRIYEWMGRGGDLSIRKTGPKGSHKVDMERLQLQISRTPDATLQEVAAAQGVHYSTISYALKRLGHTRKKNVVISGETKLSKN